MFTQCEHCQAIFRINMREVTVAKGQLRCGECREVFNASKSLSTSMHEPFKAIEIENLATEKETANDLKSTQVLDDWQTSPNITPAKTSTSANSTLKNTPNQPEHYVNSHFERLIKGVEQKSKHSDGTTNRRNIRLTLTALGLALLLVLQIAFNYRHLLLSNKSYQPEKIQMLNHNVFAHPIEAGVLLISASIENTAEFDQPFPTLEVRLTNSQAKLVALRRFTPDEYLDNHTKGMLLRKNQATSLKLKIKDPGRQATRFQFDFL